jgi:hypothetical protein
MITEDALDQIYIQKLYAVRSRIPTHCAMSAVYVVKRSCVRGKSCTKECNSSHFSQGRERSHWFFITLHAQRM